MERVGGATRLDAPVRVLHAARGSAVEEMSLDAFVDRCGVYVAGGGCMIEQPFQERLADGMIRCYLVGDRVADFGHQHVTALLPLPAGTGETSAPPARLYDGPRDARGEDTYVLCEIYGSSVYPFPDEALDPLAENVTRRLTSPARRS